MFFPQKADATDKPVERNQSIITVHKNIRKTVGK